MLVDVGNYPETAQMIAEWDEACAANAAMLDKPWAQLVDSYVCFHSKAYCWLESIWR